MDKQQINILLVDDNPHILSSLPPLLLGHFNEVKTLDNPHKLLPTLIQGDYGLILLDMNYTAGANNGREGYAYLLQVLKHNPDALVVLMTGSEGVEMAIKGVKAGAADFILKPWNFEKLLANLDLLIRLRTLEEQVEQLRILLHKKKKKKKKGETLNLKEVEKQCIEKAVYAYRGNMSHAARQLGVSRATLYAKMKKYGLSSQ
jgi:DNA-binding NtrC family response regulator